MAKLRKAGLILIAGLVAIGCGGSQREYKHTSAEEKALQEANSLTPEQQIERAQNSPLPPEQKEALIRSIKEKNGLK